jgi:hypothetical protein
MKSDWYTKLSHLDTSAASLRVICDKGMTATRSMLNLPNRLEMMRLTGKTVKSQDARRT